jgi:hypothetical protein
MKKTQPLTFPINKLKFKVKIFKNKNKKKIIVTENPNGKKPPFPMASEVTFVKLLIDK